MSNRLTRKEAEQRLLLISDLVVKLTGRINGPLNSAQINEFGIGELLRDIGGLSNPNCPLSHVLPNKDTEHGN